MTNPMLAKTICRAILTQRISQTNSSESAETTSKLAGRGASTSSSQDQSQAARINQDVGAPMPMLSAKLVAPCSIDLSYSQALENNFIHQESMAPNYIGSGSRLHHNHQPVLWTGSSGGNNLGAPTSLLLRDWATNCSQHQQPNQHRAHLRLLEEEIQPTTRSA